MRTTLKIITPFDSKPNSIQLQLQRTLKTKSEGVVLRTEVSSVIELDGSSSQIAWSIHSFAQQLEQSIMKGNLK